MPWGVFCRRFASRSADSDLDQARKWLITLSPLTIPRHIGHVSFSRSSGPGGQNVNKVNSKATLKVPLAALLPLVPRLLHPELQASRYTSDRSQTLVIHSDESRKQHSNVESCFEKLHQLLQTSARQVIPGETSPEQRDRVHKLSASYLTGFPPLAPTNHACRQATGAERIEAQDQEIPQRQEK
ncbi:hypothetical protein N7492_008805 [Penicillium capsulatum]|uniref:Prokaryotic-type class I peptide chain release factors domain-containing protein n=1 Tax=Penicillium capsulatum TaxID=69766 RepID=A0A9W9HS29_9EURO|nr:hypothetical protein N7492_008805 [Penicillium capsulatum]KAJ6106206.1 hypothetical protein N7512_009723 [Penicillium capsulatum]